MVRDRLSELKKVSVGRRSVTESDADHVDSPLLSTENWSQIDNFLGQVSKVRDDISSLEAKHREIKQLHSRLLTTPNADSVLTHQVNGIVREFQIESNNVRNMVKSMDEEVKRLEKEAKERGSDDVSSADLRIKKNQVMGVVRALSQLVTHFHAEQCEYKEKSTRKIKEYMHVVGHGMSDEDIDDAIENGTLEEKTKGMMLAYTEKKALFENVQSRHDELIKLEASIRELAEMFKDLQLLVASQGEMLDHIETNVNNAVEYAVKARENVESAKRLQAGARKKKILICIFVIVLVIILFIFLQGLVCHFTPIC